MILALYLLRETSAQQSPSNPHGIIAVGGSLDICRRSSRHGVSIILVVAAEMVVGKVGLGARLYLAGQVLETEQVFAVLIVLAILGVAVTKAQDLIDGWLANGVFRRSLQSKPALMRRPWVARSTRLIRPSRRRVGYHPHQLRRRIWQPVNETQPPQVGTKRNFEKKHFNYGRWTKGRFSEAVTVTGPAKMVFLAGIGSEHEQTGKIMYPGDFTAQCRYAFRKFKKVLARNGASMADVVKQVTYRGRRSPSATGRKMPPGSLRQSAAAGTHISQRQPTCLARNAGRD